MPKTKGEKRFFLYKDKIVTRIDRSDKSWHTYLDYKDAPHPKLHDTVVFDQALDRK